jgi:hypothetical protein
MKKRAFNKLNKIEKIKKSNKKNISTNNNVKKQKKTFSIIH